MPAVLSSAVPENAKGTYIYTFSAVSTVPSVVPAIVYPITTVSPTLMLRSLTEAVSSPVLRIPLLSIGGQFSDTESSVSDVQIPDISSHADGQVSVAEVRECNVPIRSDNIVSQKDYAIKEPMITSADVNPIIIVPHDKVSKEASSTQTMPTSEARETVLDEHSSDETSQGQVFVSKARSINTNQMPLAVTEFPIIDICSPTEKHLTNATSAFKEPVSKIELGATDETSSAKALGLTVGFAATEPFLAPNVGAVDVPLPTEATQPTLNLSTPEPICVTIANKQDSNSISVNSEPVSGSVIEVCGTDVDLSNEAQEQGVVLAMKEPASPAHATTFDETFTKEQVSKPSTVTAEPLSGSATEVCATDILSPTAAHGKGVNLAAQEPETTASISTYDVSQPTNENVPTPISVTKEQILRSVKEVNPTDGKEPTPANPTKVNSIPLPVAEETEHIEVSKQGSRTTGSLSVAEVPMFKVTLPTSESEQITRELLPGLDVDVCTGMNRKYILLYTVQYNSTSLHA